MNFILRIKYILIAFVIILMGCSEKSTNNPEADEEIADALWQQITTESYNISNDEWDHWPGKNGKHLPDTTLISSDPHLDPIAFQTFVNSAAWKRLNSRTFPLEDKSIVVKENYTISGTDTTLAVITAMLKMNGYDSDNNDWFWVKYNPDGSVVISGKASGCIGCHGLANSFHADTDYL